MGKLDTAHALGLAHFTDADSGGLHSPSGIKIRNYVQYGGSSVDTGFCLTVGEPMEKAKQDRQIPPKNAPPRELLDDAMKRVAALGLGWVDAAMQAGVSRPVAFALKRGEGSLASLRKVQDWLLTVETTRPPRGGDPVSKWSELGAELAGLDPSLFEQMLDGLRDLVEAKKMEDGAKLKMFRINPDRRK